MIDDADKSPDKGREIVTENVLNSACSQQDWEPSDIQRAFSVSTSNGHEPRTMLVTFHSSDDKFRMQVCWASGVNRARFSCRR